MSRPAIFSSGQPRKGATLVEVDRELHIPVELDGTDHRQYRRILVPLFSPKRLTELDGEVRAIARELLDALDAETFDVVAQYARPLVSAMFLRILDWPLDDREELEVLADRQLNGEPGASASEMAAIKLEASLKIDDYCAKRIAERRAAPGDDMTTMLMRSRLANGEVIPEDQLIRLVRLLLIAGLDTTQSVTSQAINYLGAHPEAQEYFRTHPDELAPMVEEILRWGTPAQPARTAMEVTTVDGVEMLPGDKVLCLLAGASRDPELFESPGEMDLTRRDFRHVAFSTGPHKCIGGPLARLVLAAALDEFHQAIPEYTVRDVSSYTGTVWRLGHLQIETGKPA